MGVEVTLVFAKKPSSPTYYQIILSATSSKENNSALVYSCLAKKK